MIISITAQCEPSINNVQYNNKQFNKKAFYRSFNAIFGRVGRLSTEEVVLHLIKAKCLPVLLYGLEVCLVNVSDMRSLEFTLKRLMIKLFRTYDSGVINSCVVLWFINS